MTTATRKMTIRGGMIALVALLSTAVFAQSFPAYYPSEGFQRVGRIDAVLPTDGRIVINDIPYGVSDSVIVHALNAYSVPRSRLQPGTNIGFKMVSGRVITEIWILPDSYRGRGRR